MTRDEIIALLPFLANDTLTGEERAEVEAAEVEDAEMQAELAALRAIRNTMQTEQGYSPGEMGLGRLMREVEAEAPAAIRPRATPRWAWQAVAAALLAVVVGQAVFLSRAPDDPGGFTLAGADAAFTIAVRPDTTEEALRALLLDAGVEIVGGPSALGLYQLATIEGVTNEQAIAILSASDIVESLEVPDD